MAEEKAKGADALAVDKLDDAPDDEIDYGDMEPPKAAAEKDGRKKKYAKRVSAEFNAPLHELNQRARAAADAARAANERLENAATKARKAEQAKIDKELAKAAKAAKAAEQG